MAVIGSWCQICGIPVQQDHYVELDGMLGIYRGDGHDSFTPAVCFGSEHRWLREAVGLRINTSQSPPIITGLVHDGAFESPDESRQPNGFVWDGLDERAALHEACWTLAGKPECWTALADPAPTQYLRPYQGQLFDFAALVREQNGWMIVDPREPSADGQRNHDRILGLLRTIKQR